MIQVPKLGTAIEAENGMNGSSLESEVTSGEEGAVNSRWTEYVSQDKRLW